MAAVFDLEHHFDKRVKTFGIVLPEIVTRVIRQFVDTSVLVLITQKIRNPAVVVGHLLIRKRPEFGHFIVFFQFNCYACSRHAFRDIQNVTRERLEINFNDNCQIENVNKKWHILFIIKK